MTDRGPTADVPGPHGGREVVAAGAPRGAARAVVIALHGRGATGQGIVNLLDPVHRHGVAVLAPSAERSRWYPGGAAAPVERNEPHLSSALAVVDALVDHAVEVAGVPPENVVLLGFSQGACVVAERAARTPDRHPVVVLSGTLLGPTVDPDRYVRPGDEDGGPMDGTPVFVGWGADDALVPADRVRATADTFRRLGGAVTERPYDGVGHAVTDDEFDRVGRLLDDLLSNARD